MFWKEMGCRWTSYGIQLASIALLILVFGVHGNSSLNSEGLALLNFRARITSDPFGALVNWEPQDSDHCMWSGVKCVDDKVEILDLNGCSLEGTLAPELGDLTYLRALILSKNHFSGVIPKQFGQLAVLEVLDLRNNDLYGTIPAEIGGLLSLRRLLLCNNKFEGSIPLAIGKLDLLTEVQFDANLTPPVAAEVACLNRKIVQCEWQSSVNPLRKADSFLTPIKGTIYRYFSVFPVIGRIESSDSYSRVTSSPVPYVHQQKKYVIEVSRRKLAEQSSNLQATPPNGGAPLDQFIYQPSSRSSGSFPAVPSPKKSFPPPMPSSPGPLLPPPHNASSPPEQSSAAIVQPEAPDTGNSSHTWKYIAGISGGSFFVIFSAVMIFICRSRAAKTISPWKTGLSGQLQKAFVTGVPKLNRTELETACEDFSNIIEMHDEVAVYKGTLSSGVEIAVISTTITSIKDWSKRAELIYRKKIDTMSRVNHKNYVNLIGYCEEDEPFVRMMVFEYAPNGTLSEHLHVKEVEHLDWNSRMRIIMGTAYCLQHMHDLNPAVAHSNLTSKAIYLTDDYAAKIAEISFWAECLPKSTMSDENDTEHSELPPPEDPETNVYCFGLLLLELISGKVPYSEEQRTLLNWAAEYLHDKRSISYLIDPSLKSFKDNELHIICEVIQECIQPDARKRPTMKEITSKLRAVLDISPESATPRLSPLWWAELEILSSEAT
ncbi:hypothetical protein M9H77_26159 [Catharanthus roseus]|uniref:Uncharacterized protein n=1 Tax=Catharanthus roseus TaxID=4058 RepID=A0ACC0A9W1_CATRO|nr:hypothetical protein M9H77_26159 [Catharanthus roseus]